MLNKAHAGRVGLAALGLLAALTACGGRNKGPSATEILANAAQATLDTQSVQFAIEHEGEPPVVETSTGAKFISANGFYQAPDTISVTVRAETLFGVQDLGVIWSPGGNNVTIPGLGTMPVTEDFAFNPTTLFHEAGLPAVLTESLTGVTLVGEELLEGVNVYHLSGSASGVSLSSLTAGTVGVDDMAVDVYVERETFRVVRMVLTEPSGDRWLLDLFAYDEPVVG